MKSETHPIRRRIVAATAAAVGLVGLSSEAGDANHAVPTLAEAQQQFDNVAKATGIKILGDIANPKSNLSGTYQSDKGTLKNTSEKEEVPEMNADYAEIEDIRAIDIETINMPDPNTFNSISLWFKVTGKTAARLSSEVKTGKVLRVTDYIEALHSSDVMVEGAEVGNDTDISGEMVLAHNEKGRLSFESSDRYFGNPDNTLTQENASETVDSFGTDMTAVENTLRMQLDES